MSETLSLTPSRFKRGRPRRSGGALDLALFESMARRQAKIYHWMQERWIHAIRALNSPLIDETTGLEVPMESRERSIIDDMIRDGFRDVGMFIARVAPAIIAATKARKEIMAAQPIGELEEQFRAELTNAVKSFSPEELAAVAKQLTPEAWDTMIRERSAAESAPQETP